MTNTMLSDAEYVAKAGAVCPHCKSDRIKSGTVNHAGSELYQDVDCLACNESWVDVYQLVGWSCG